MLCFFLVLAVVAADAADPVAVRGTVSDSNSSKLLADAEVAIKDSSGAVVHTRADRYGNYRAIGLSFGTIEVSVMLSGYAPESQTCYVTSGDTLRLDVGLVTRYTNIGRRNFSCLIEPRTSDLYRR